MSYYSSELNCIRNSKVFAQQCQTDHLYEVMGGHFNWSIHHTGMGGPTADQKFYDPERVCIDDADIVFTYLFFSQVKDYTGSIRFKDPERTVPVVA